MDLPFKVPWFARWLAVAAVATLAVLVALIYLGADDDARTALNDKAFETVMQLVIVAGIGGAVGLVYKLIEGSVEEARRRQQRRTDYVSRLGASFRDAKAARRILRAAGLACAPASKPGVPCAPGTMPGVLTDAQRATYDEQFLVINKAQLALESLKIEAQCFPDPGKAEALQTALGRMERYLGDIVSEYEDMRPRQPLSFDCLPRLDEFTSSSGKSPGGCKTFGCDFQTAFRTATDAVLDCDPKRTRSSKPDPCKPNQQKKDESVPPCPRDTLKHMDCSKGAATQGATGSRGTTTPAVRTAARFRYADAPGERVVRRGAGWLRRTARRIR